MPVQFNSVTSLCSLHAFSVGKTVQNGRDLAPIAFCEEAERERERERDIAL